MSEPQKKKTYIDKAQFLELIDHNKELFEGLLNIYKNDWPSLYSKLEIEIQNQNFNEIEKISHRLKGSLRNFFAQDAADRVEKIEELCAGERIKEIQESLIGLELQFKEIETELEALFYREF